jgi:glycosyltransferase involved in cell wall biosynthesis
MRVAIVSEHRFHRTPQGFVTAGPFPYSSWKRYLTVFDSVLIVARSVAQEPAPAEALRSDGPGVAFYPLPDYRGPRQFFRKARETRRALLAAIADSDAVILRLPSALACLVGGRLRRTRRPYAVEVVGDPWDALGPGAHRHPLRAFFRRILTCLQKRQCAASSAALYVTRQALQGRYPPPPGRFTTGCSDVELPRSAFTALPRPRRAVSIEPAAVTVGSLGHLYKAPDVLLEAVALCARNGLRLRVAIVGDGQYRQALETRARLLEIEDLVVFRGHLTFGAAVRRELDVADLFVLPSRQEGLPRALLEAMAQALPAIGSTVGGIPELLAPENLVPPNDPAALARKLEEVLRDPSRLQGMSAANLRKAHEYEEKQLEQRRNLFLNHVRAETEKHLRGGADAAFVGEPVSPRDIGR